MEIYILERRIWSRYFLSLSIESQLEALVASKITVCRLTVF